VVEGAAVTAERRWCPKGLREHLCQQQTWAPDDFTRQEIQRLIGVLDLHRPLGGDGKHGELHTPTCGCEDAPRPVAVECRRSWTDRDGEGHRCMYPAADAHDCGCMCGSLMRDEVGGGGGPRCPAVLNLSGDHFDCDLPAPHKGWGHANRAADAVWSSGPSNGLPDPREQL
jgi:hypothetical protein